MTTITLPGPLVEAAWVFEHLQNPELIVLEVVLNQGEEENHKISRSRVFNIDEVSDKNSKLPHMLPPVEQFAEAVRRLGINRESTIVLYDAKGIYSSPRAWFMFRAFGFQKVAVLNGGLPCWFEAQYPTSVREENHNYELLLKGNFVPTEAKESALFCDSNTVQRAIAATQFKIIDARTEGRFYAKEPEPRAGLRGGHIVSSINIPFAQVLSLKKMKTTSELKSIFSKHGMIEQNLIFSCGSGVTACIVGLAAYVAGYRKISIYDGSWTEWASDPRRQIATEK